MLRKSETYVSGKRDFKHRKREKGRGHAWHGDWGGGGDSTVSAEPFVKFWKSGRKDSTEERHLKKKKS